LSTTDLIQLYAPLAGLLALAFWTGVLSQKVSNLSDRLVKLETESDGDMKTVDRLARLETKMDAQHGELEKVSRNLEGVQRQLGNIAGGRSALNTNT
jgi:hypothetical protein